MERHLGGFSYHATRFAGTDGTRVAGASRAGVYLYELRAGDAVARGKVVLTR